MPPSHVEPASGGAQTAAIVGGVVGGVSFVAILATCLFCVRRKRRSARTRALYGFDQTSSDKGTGSGGLTGAIEADNSRWGWVTFNRNASRSEGGPLGASRSEITREPKGSVDLTLPPQARIANSPWAQFGDAEAQQFPPVPPIIHVPASLSIQDPFRTPAPTPKISIDLPPSYPAILDPNPHPVPQPASRPSLDLEGVPKRSRRVPVPTS
ncbi:hypothetical protein BT69DRAFT_18715 [Atractiella rhizophila]|nr:hypothetical protein BT69DRAFT_18715 [Atractiella rhizophila]